MIEARLNGGNGEHLRLEVPCWNLKNEDRTNDFRASELLQTFKNTGLEIRRDKSSLPK